jgi:hypothetical protein
MKVAQMMKRYGATLMSQKWLKRMRLEREAKQKGIGAVRCDGFEGREARWLGGQAHIFSLDRLWEY